MKFGHFGPPTHPLPPLQLPQTPNTPVHQTHSNDFIIKTAAKTRQKVQIANLTGEAQKIQAARMLQNRFRDNKKERLSGIKKLQRGKVEVAAKSDHQKTVQIRASKAWKKFKVVSKVMNASMKMQMLKKIQRAYRAHRLYKPSKIKVAIEDEREKQDLDAMDKERKVLETKLREVQWDMFNRQLKVERLPPLAHSSRFERLRNYGVGHLEQADITPAETRRRSIRRLSTVSFKEKISDIIGSFDPDEKRVFAKAPNGHHYYRATLIKFSHADDDTHHRKSRMIVRFDMMYSKKARKREAEKEERTRQARQHQDHDHTEGRQHEEQEYAHGEVGYYSGSSDEARESSGDDIHSADTEVRADGVVAIKKGDVVAAKHPANGMEYECKVLGKASPQDVERFQKEKRAPSLAADEPLWFYVRFATDRLRFIVPFSWVNLIQERLADCGSSQRRTESGVLVRA